MHSNREASSIYNFASLLFVAGLETLATKPEPEHPHIQIIPPANAVVVEPLLMSLGVSDLEC
jgi:hypothetical protein